jgi:AcrR family transcriptional regulator
MPRPPQSDETPKAGKGDESVVSEEIKYPRRTARRKLTREKIIRAAARLFNDAGYSATTMQNIADAADVHVTTLFMHFNSKADLATEFGVAATDELRERAFAARDSVPFLDFFRAELDRAVAVSKKQSSQSLMLWRGLRDEKDLAYALAAYEQALRDIYAEYVAHVYGLDRAADFRADIVAAILVSSVSLANDKWVEAPNMIDLGAELSRAVAVAETAVFAILEQLA